MCWRSCRGIFTSPIGGEVKKLPTHHQPLQAMEMIHIVVLWLLRQSQFGQTAEEFAERHLQLDAGERRADAEVDAGAEADIGAIGAEGIEAVGTGEARRVAIGGPEHQADDVTLLELQAL